jgi:phage gpG-like protein
MAREDFIFHVPEERGESLAYYIETSGDRAEELKPVLEDILDKIMFRERRMFETRGATSGVYWSPLRGTTVKRKEKLGAPHPFDPLRRFGPLEESLTVKGSDNQIASVDDDGLLLATTIEYASYHVTGTSRMPARPPLIIPAKHAREYVDDINKFIFGIERNEGGGEGA